MNSIRPFGLSVDLLPCGNLSLSKLIILVLLSSKDLMHITCITRETNLRQELSTGDLVPSLFPHAYTTEGWDGMLAPCFKFEIFRLGWLLVCCLYKEVYLHIFKCVSFWLHGCCGEWEGRVLKPFNHTSWVAVVIPTDRPKSVRNRCVIELLCGIICDVTLPFWHFCWCRDFCHRTESDLFLFLFELHLDVNYRWKGKTYSNKFWLVEVANSRLCFQYIHTKSLFLARKMSYKYLELATEELKIKVIWF